MSFEKRYIDAGAFKDQMLATALKQDLNMQRLQDLFTIIDEQPTVKCGVPVMCQDCVACEKLARIEQEMPLKFVYATSLRCTLFDRNVSPMGYCHLGRPRIPQEVADE